MGGNERKYVQEAFDTNWIAPLGPNVTGFEEDLKSYLEEEKEVAVLSSGTAAIHLGLILLGVKAGDEVICQTMTFVASVNPILYQGAKPIFVDGEKETWNMSPHYLEEAIKDRIAKGKKPKAIILVHSYGMPAKIDEILAISSNYGIPIVEDAAEALGSTYKGRKCGTFGDFGVLSFNGNKIITTSGGGALVCNTKEIRDRATFIATQARDIAVHYEHSELGYNYRMSNVVAGIGRGQMEVLDKRVYLRREMNNFYKEIFKNVEGVTVFGEPDKDFFSNHWLSCITIDESKSKFSLEKFRLALFEDNIESRPVWKPMHLQPLFKGSKFYGTNVSENLFKTGLCLPSGSNLVDSDRQRIAKKIKELL
jgi:dTDP-4-amino-4,6-dideoxygalactose transaminase